jgi:anti-sigma B factor antagonist
MKTIIQEQDGKTIVFFEGRLDTVAAPDTAEACKPLFDCKDQDIIIDCTKLEFIASSGLSVLLDILKYTKPNGCKVIIKGLSDDLREIFELTGFSNFFEFM